MMLLKWLERDPEDIILIFDDHIILRRLPVPILQ
jgi:hypothetical protein